MRFLSIKANNFLSFKELDFILPKAGLYFVGGEVQNSTMSSSNGAGKSAIFEALCWGLYGKTIRNAGKDDVVNREVNKNCFVEIIAEDDEGTYYVVHRYRQDEKWQNTLRLHKGEKEVTSADVFKTQEIIDSTFGLSWLVFSTAVVFGEKAKRFIEAGDAEKKEIFDEILMLYMYQQAQQMVKNDLKKLVSGKETLEVDLGQAEAGLNEVAEELALNKDALKRVEEEKKDIQRQVQEKTMLVVDLDENLKVARGALGEAGEDLKTLEAENTRLYTYIEQTRKGESEEMEALRKITYSAHEKVSPIMFKIEELETWLGSKEKLPEGSRCKVCGTEISKDSIEGVAEHYEKELAKLRPQYEELEIIHQEALKREGEASRGWEKKLRETERAKSELDEEVSEQRKIIHKAESDIFKLEADARTIKQEIGHLEEGYKKKEAMFLETEERLREKNNNYKERIEILEKEITIADEEAQYLKFWVEGFGNQGIKSLLLDEILPLLNTRVSYYSSVLLGDTIRISFDTETMLKSGEARDKFGIKLFIDDKETKYENCSAGEKRRIDVSVLLALQNLIFGRSASGCNLVVFDEVFDSLDSVGIEKIIDLLKEESGDKAIFVISHISELADYFDNVLMVRKENEVSTLEV